MMTTVSELQRTLSGISLLLSPVFGLLAEMLRYAGSEAIYIWSGLSALIGMALSVQVVLGLRHMLSPRAPRLAVYGCGLALMLTLSGPGIITLYLITWALLPDMAAAEAVGRAALSKLFPIIFLPGLLYMICRVVIALGLWRVKAIPIWAGLLMALGYLLIPAGRIPNIPPLVYLASTLVLLSEGWIGWKVLTQRGFWQQEAAAV